jgi:hypothetical protein
MIAAILELFTVLLKGRQLTVNTVTTFLILAGVVAGIYIALSNDGHLARIDNHLQYEDTDIILMKQALGDAGIHVQQQNQFESPRRRGEDSPDGASRPAITNNFAAIAAARATNNDGD